MRKPLPISLIYKGLALLHLLVGFVLYWNVLKDWVQAGFFNAVEPHWDRMAAFWFLLCGWFLGMLGMAAQQLEAPGQTEGQSVRWQVLAASTVGTLCIPKSGFPLGILLSLAQFRDSGKAR